MASYSEEQEQHDKARLHVSICSLHYTPVVTSLLETTLLQQIISIHKPRTSTSGIRSASSAPGPVFRGSPTAVLLVNFCGLNEIDVTITHACSSDDKDTSVGEQGRGVPVGYERSACRSGSWPKIATTTPENKRLVADWWCIGKLA
jgi:hypothetical protein